MAACKRQYNIEVKFIDSELRELEYKSCLYCCELLDKQLIILCLSFLISKIGRIIFLYLFRLLGRLDEFLFVTPLEQAWHAVRVRGELCLLAANLGRWGQVKASAEQA